MDHERLAEASLVIFLVVVRAFELHLVLRRCVLNDKKSVQL